MCDLDLEGPSCSSEKWRKARVAHRCCSCREAIQPGQHYHYYSGIWDGEPESYKHCGRCWTIVEALFERSIEPVDLTLNCGMTWEGAFREDPPPNVAAMAFALPGEVTR